MKYSLDGITWHKADEIRVVYDELPLTATETGQLHINLTHEGLIMDVWENQQALDDGDSPFTKSVTADELANKIISENS